MVECWLVLGCLFLALGLRVATMSPEWGTDKARFLAQADSLQSGQGFARDGRLETSLPPGYPLFIASVLGATGSRIVLRCTQIALSVGSCFLLYRACRPRGRIAGLLALAALAFSPFVARAAGGINSETLGIFWMALLVWHISRQELQPGPWPLIAAGALCTALVLTSPATTFLVMGIGSALLWQQRRRPGRCALLMLGGLSLMVPWQIHCYRALGTIEPRILTPLPTFHRGFYQWARTVTRSEDDFWVVFDAVMRPNRRGIDAIPPDQLPYGAERQRVQAITDAFHQQKMSEDQVHVALAEIAEKKIRGNAGLIGVRLPLARAAALWHYMPTVPGHTRAKVGNSSLTLDQILRLRDGNAATTTHQLPLLAALYACHLLYFILFGAAAAISLFARRLMPWAIVAGVVAYTALSAWLGLGEARRNLVFYPALLFLLLYVPHGRRRRSAE